MVWISPIFYELWVKTLIYKKASFSTLYDMVINLKSRIPQKVTHAEVQILVPCENIYNFVQSDKIPWKSNYTNPKGFGHLNKATFMT